MIEHGTFIIPPGKSTPGVVGKERAVAPCGCTCYCGRRTDNKEVASVAIACSDEHEASMDTFNKGLHDSLATPEDRPLAEVADEILAMVYA